MRICELKQIDTETVTNVILVDDYDEDGDLVGQHEETVVKEVPVMGTVYRDATPEEEAEAEAEAERIAAEMAAMPPTVEERMADVEDALCEVAEMGAEGADRIAELEDAIIELASLLA